MAPFNMTYAPPKSLAIDYGEDVEAEIARLCTQIERFPAVTQAYPPRWLALKLLEQDSDLQHKLLQLEGGPAVVTHGQLSYARLVSMHGADIDAVIADRRYSWIHTVVMQTLHQTAQEGLTLSDKIDRVVTHKVIGVPIFLLAMWMVFRLTADVSAPLVDWIDAVISGPLSNRTLALLTFAGLEGTWFASLLVDGIIAGVGGLLVFVPVLMSLYLALAVLEDSGYMARAAFVMDSLMTKIGLQGKSFLPLMVGFGCSVPAIYATRTLENERDRILTAMLVPFMSCGARLPVYVLFAAIFFPHYAGTIVFSLYLLGILTAIILGFILRRTVFHDEEQTAFVMELPPYRVPTFKSIWFHMWQRTRAFLASAWTLILAVSVIIWLLMAIPVQGEGQFADTELDQSAFATVSGVIAPVLQPLGFGNWESSGALISGFVAKEVVVTTMAQTYGLEEASDGVALPTAWEDLREIVVGFGQAIIDTVKSLPLLVGMNLQPDEAEEPSSLMLAIKDGFEEVSGGHGALAALAFMVFVLIYTPCMVAVNAERQELGAKWMWVNVIGQFILAWTMAFLVFQGGKLLGLG